MCCCVLLGETFSGIFIKSSDRVRRGLATIVSTSSRNNFSPKERSISMFAVDSFLFFVFGNCLLIGFFLLFLLFVNNPLDGVSSSLTLLKSKQAWNANSVTLQYPNIVLVFE